MDTPNPSRQRKNLQRRTRRAERNKQLKEHNSPGGTFLKGWGREMSIPSKHNSSGQRIKKSNRNRLTVKAKHKKRLARKP